MFIKKIQINSFGCISDKEYEFDKKFNFIYGKNESGKSTLFAFVLFMFYGTKIKKAPGGLTFKEKYMPWSGKPMHGRVVFEYNGSTYDLSRMVSSTETFVSLLNIDTGEQVRDREILNSPGEKFLGVGVQAFYNTAFISDSSSDHMSVDEIITKLTSLQSNSDSEVSYNNILDIIDSEISQLSSDRRKQAEIPFLALQLQKKYDELNSICETETDKESLASELENLDNDIEKLEQEINSLKCTESVPARTVKKDFKKTPMYSLLGVGLFIGICITILVLFLTTVTVAAVFLALFLSVLCAFWITSRKRLLEESDTKLFTLQQNNVKIVALTERLSALRLEHERKERLLFDLNSVAVSKEFLCSEIQALEDDLKNAKKKLQAFQLARLAVSNAYQEYKKSFSPKLSETAGNILKDLTDAKYDAAVINDELNLYVNSPYGYKTSDSFSRGSFQQTEFAKRIALCQTVFNDETPFFLDDAFAFFDEDRLNSAFLILHDISHKTQVFFSSCRRKELEIMAEKNVNILFFK